MYQTETLFPTDTSPCFNLKGSLVSMTILDLLHFESSQFSQQLAEKIKQAPLFFKNAPIIISLEREASHQVDINYVTQLCKEQGLIPIAIRGGSPSQRKQSETLGLTVFPTDQVLSKQVIKPHVGERNEPMQALEVETSGATIDPETIFLPAKVITTPIRSGQKVYASCTDLIIMAPVSPGAEVLADGNIHVYAPLRGRALAGVMGDENARIFTTHLEAELLSVAGFYKTSEDLQAVWKQPIHAYLERERLHINAI